MMIKDFLFNYDYINIDLLLFSSLMLGRTIYLKVIAHNSYLGLQFQTRSFLGSSWSSVSQNFNGNTPSGSQQRNIQNLSTLVLNQKAQKQNQTSQLNNQNTQQSQAKRKVSRGNRHLLINAIMLTFMIVQLTCMWRLYFYNTLHNFICLFYPIMFELCLFGIQTKFALIDSPNHQEYASNQRYSSAIHEFLHLAKTVLFQSFEVAYYTGFITVKFIPQDLAIYFDTFTLQIFTMFLWINAVTILTSHYMQLRFVELQFNAQLLGKWSAYKGKDGYLQGGVGINSSSGKLNSVNVTNYELNQSDFKNSMMQNSNWQSVQQQQLPQANLIQQQALFDQNQHSIPQQSPWHLTQTYFKDTLVSYQNRLYKATGSEIGNYSRPDDLCSWAIFELFHQPSRTFVVIHCIYGLFVLLYCFLALNQRTQLYIYLAQMLSGFAMMMQSFQFCQKIARKYAFINQMSAG